MLLPDPSSIYNNDDDVIVQFRECELRMTFPQWCSFIETANAWNFRDGRGEPADLNSEDYCGAAEHESLRKIVKSMRYDGTLEDVVVPDALKWKLDAILTREGLSDDSWISLHEQIRALREENAELRKRKAKHKLKAVPP